MPVIGEVNISLFWGTLYDEINVPFHPQQIIDESTKSMNLDGYLVWQTTYLSNIRLNINNYQDIVGVQYARITDVGTTNNGAHWYTVIDYQQVSQGCVEIGLKYNPILTIPISTITSISGILRRWTPDVDNLYNYINTSEPIDLADPLSIQWIYVPCITDTSSPLQLAGFPYDMTEPPEVITYTNPSGATTNVYYPKLPPPKAATVFTSGLSPAGSPTAFQYADGLSYYKFTPSSKCYETYNAAVSLAIDIPVNAYIVPDASWVVTSGTDELTLITGVQKSFPVSFSLYNTNVRNKKAGAINTTFTLSNLMSGDAVTVSNYQLTNTDISVYSLPYSTGCLIARFHTYMGDNGRGSGLVSSPTWQPLTVTSGVGFGVQSNTISNTMSSDTLYLQATQTQTRAIFDRNQVSDAGTMAIAKQSIDTMASVMANSIVTKDSKNSFAVGLKSIITGATANAQTAVNTAQQMSRLNFIAAQEDAIATQQKEMLAYQGNVGRMAPPLVKYAGSKDQNRYTYSFVVMKASPSTNDITRMDNFFTAYGYNVDGIQLNDVNQLSCRDKFTFIQADNVRITSTIYSATNERIGDMQTILDIQKRFSAGLRIWKTTPDFDYTKPNNITEE